MANTIVHSEGRQREEVPYSLTAAAAENFQINLEGEYAAVDFLDIENKVTSVVEEVKLKIQLEDSIDGGETWFATEGSAALTEVVEAKTGLPSLQRTKLAEKPHGRLLRLNFKFGAKGKVVGTVVVATSPA